MQLPYSRVRKVLIFDTKSDNFSDFPILKRRYRCVDGNPTIQPGVERPLKILDNILRVRYVAERDGRL